LISQPTLMNKYGLTFHHLGLAVNAPEVAVSFLEALDYVIGKSVLDARQNVHLLMCDHPTMPSIEVISPGAKPGPLDRLLVRHKEGLVYHMCYTTQDPTASLRAMRAEGRLRLSCVSPPKAAALFGGKQVSFYLVADVGLIELIDESTLVGPVPDCHNSR
jgi:Glyoxalase/Bleomycin resistance protein/Dioxygenase superfamily